MSFLWPEYLWALLALPLLPVAYAWLLHRRTRSAHRLSSLQIMKLAQGSPWRRHVPPAILLVAIGLLLLALSRPTALVTLPWSQSTIILAIDVSLSMRVGDVAPSRMVAAQEAAKAFLAEVPRHVDVGIVTFAGTAQVAQQPTRDRPSLIRAIDAIQMQRGTAVGSAIVVSLAELFPDQGIDLEAMLFGPDRRARPLSERNRPPPQVVQPVAPGSHEAAVVILLTDGRRTTGVDTLEAAQMAAQRGVRVHTIGLGTPDGHLAEGEGMSYYLQLDEASLREVARMTAADYHQAATAEVLRGIYRDLGSTVQSRARETELTALLSLMAAALIVLGAGLSLWWFGRVA